MLRQNFCARGARVALVATLLFVAIGPAYAVDPADIVRVEEDWELVIFEPDADTVAPQVTCVTAAAGSLDGWYVAFELNHQTLPDFQAGGLHLQVYGNDDWYTVRNGHDDELLGFSGETVSWTQRLRVEGTSVTFEVIDGQSPSWGHFGDESGLRATVPAGLANLNAYTPNTSVDHSGVGYSANRVQSLKLLRVRYTRANGESWSDDTVRSVYPKN